MELRQLLRIRPTICHLVAGRFIVIFFPHNILVKCINMYNSYRTNRFCVDAGNRLYYIGGNDELINQRWRRRRERLPTTV